MPFDCAIQKELALKIDCQILIKSMQVGLASAQHNIPVFGTTSLDLRFRTENGEFKTFEVSALVIEDLSDSINLSINWLKKNDITLFLKTVII